PPVSGGDGTDPVQRGSRPAPRSRAARRGGNRPRTTRYGPRTRSSRRNSNFSRRHRPSQDASRARQTAASETPGRAASLAIRGARRKPPYPQKSSSPPTPERTTVSPASRAARATKYVFTPSIDG